MPGILTKDTTFYAKAEGANDFTEIELLMEVPELGGDPEKIEVTTLKDSVKKYIPGVPDLGDLAFKFLYDNSTTNSNYRVLKGIQDSGKPAAFKVEYPDGTSHEFDAYVRVKMDAGPTNAVLTFTATMIMQSDIRTTNPSTSN